MKQLPESKPAWKKLLTSIGNFAVDTINPFIAGARASRRNTDAQIENNRAIEAKRQEMQVAQMKLSLVQQQANMNLQSEMSERNRQHARELELERQEFQSQLALFSSKKAKEFCQKLS
jgi:IMP dehydrogenase/GMP reductase